MTKSGVLILGLVLLLSACGGERPVRPPEPLPGPQLILDDAFGTQGQVRTGLKQYSESYAAVLQPDGKVVAVGTTSDGEDAFFGLVRYLPDGTLDASFGDGGKVVTDLQPPGTSFRSGFPYAATLQQDGKVVVGGVLYSGGPRYARQLVVIRYTPDGKLDTTFGTGGFFSSETFGESAAYDAAVQPDGKIVVVGELGDDTLLLRLTPEGGLDPSFGTGGFITASLYGREASLALTRNGQYLVGSGRSLTRYNPDGSVDPSFKRLFEYGPVDLALQADGRIIVGGTRKVNYGDGLTLQTSPLPSQTEMVVQRLSENGAVDPNFGQGGVAVVGRGGYRALKDLAVQPDGKVVVLDYNALVARLSADGALEASAVGTSETAVTTLVTQDNAILIVGSVSSRNEHKFALAKFLPQAARVEQR